jgi:uncharacterized protein (DUF697 family)
MAFELGEGELAHVGRTVPGCGIKGKNETWRWMLLKAGWGENIFCGCATFGQDKGQQNNRDIEGIKMATLEELTAEVRAKRIADRAAGNPSGEVQKNAALGDSGKTMTWQDIAAARRAQRIAERDAGGQTETKHPDVSLSDRLKREIFEIEKRDDLTVEEKVKRITHITCATCAGIAIQPIPFADIFILTPIQAYMGSRIAAIRGVPVSDSEAKDVVKEIIGVVGMGILAQQAAIGIWKTITFGLGGLATIPIVYGLSYAIMRVMDAYFIAKAAKRVLTPEEIKSIWKNAKQEGEQHGKAHESATKR